MCGEGGEVGGRRGWRGVGAQSGGGELLQVGAYKQDLEGPLSQKEASRDAHLRYVMLESSLSHKNSKSIINFLFTLNIYQWCRSYYIFQTGRSNIHPRSYLAAMRGIVCSCK